jgi:hypothetical protein
MSLEHKHPATADGSEPPTRESWLGRHGPYLLLLLFLHYCIQVTIEIFEGRFDFLGMLPLLANSIIVLMVAALVGLVARVVSQLVRHASWTSILRDILGEPGSWRTWYPRILRNPASVWDKLPPTLRVMRTVLWLELLLLPAGFVLALFVLPTFQAVYAAIGIEFPLMMSALILAFEIGGYILPLIVLAALVQSWRWRARQGLPLMVALNALFSGSRDFWRDPEARRLLRS